MAHRKQREQYRKGSEWDVSFLFPPASTFEHYIMNPSRDLWVRSEVSICLQKHHHRYPEVRHWSLEKHVLILSSCQSRLPVTLLHRPAWLWFKSQPILRPWHTTQTLALSQWLSYEYICHLASFVTKPWVSQRQISQNPWATSQSYPWQTCSILQTWPSEHVPCSSIDFITWVVRIHNVEVPIRLLRWGSRKIYV